MTGGCKQPAPREWVAGALTYGAAGLAVLFFWLLWGDFAWNMKERSVVPVAQLMLKRFGASDLIVGLLIGSLPAALGMLLAPIVSVKSDRHRGRWGRRIPFLLYPVPFALVALAGLAHAPGLSDWINGRLGGSSDPQLVRILVFAFFWTLFEIASVVSNAVFGGLINDVVPHEVIGRFFGLFRAVSLLAGIVFNYLIMGHAEEQYGWIFLGIGILYGVGFPLMCLNIKEGQYPPPAPAPARALGGMIAYLRECFGQPYYLMVFAGMTLAAVSFGPVNAFSVFFAKSVGMSMDAYGKYLALTYAISLVLSYFLGVLADRFHPLRTSIAAAALYSAAMFWGGFAATTPKAFAVAFVLHGVLSGVYMTCSASLGQRLFPRAKFAQFASAGGILTAVGFFVTPALVGGIIDASGHVYRITFWAAGILAAGAVFVLLAVEARFRKLGGPKGYRPPENGRSSVF